MVSIKSIATLVAVIPFCLTHPGENEQAIQWERANQKNQHSVASRSLSKCQDLPQVLEMRGRTAARRAAKATALRMKRGINTSNFSR